MDLKNTRSIINPHYRYKFNYQYFSLGTNIDYYKSLNKLDVHLKHSVLAGLQDIVYKPEKLNEIEDEEVLNRSLFRNVTLSEVHGQFSRVLSGHGRA